MKNTIWQRILIAGLLLFSVSCKDMLEPEIYSQLTEDNFPRSEQDINSMLTAFYAQFTHDWGTSDPTSGALVYGVYTGQESWMHISSASTDELYDSWFPQYRLSWGSAFNTYQNLYAKIKFVTRATEFINVLEQADISESLRKSSIAEVKCMRAWLMFLLYDWYGPVSVKLIAEQLADLSFEPRPSEETYTNAMIADLTAAIPDLLPMTNSTSSWGKVNQGVARLLLLKLYMNDHRWEDAKTVGEELLGMGYSLQGEYKDVFINEGNSEVIWAVPSGKGYANYWFQENMPWDAKNVNGIEVLPGWAGYYMPWEFYDKFPTGDKRLQTIASGYDDIYGTHYERGGNEGWALPIGAIVIKYMVPPEQNKIGNFSTVGMRYADVLLSMAEIENELNDGPTATAIGYLEQVTDRADIEIPESADDNYQSFKDFLLDERGRELYWEGWRRQDLIRFGKYIEYAQDRGWPAEDHMVKFPIPPNVINESGGVILNNPGYN